MRTMAAGEFKAKCLAVMAEVNATGQALQVTKRGKPLARILPAEDPAAKESPEAIFGCLRNLVSAPGKTIEANEPFIPAEEWTPANEEWSVRPRE